MPTPDTGAAPTLAGKKPTISTLEVWGVAVPRSTVVLIAEDGKTYRVTTDDAGNIVDPIPPGSYSAAVVDGPYSSSLLPKQVRVLGATTNREPVAAAEPDTALLALTGSSSTTLVAIAGLLLALGAGIVRFAKVRRR